MDGIVTGKVEKPSGSLVWKTYATADLSKNVTQVDIELKTLGLGTNAYIKIETITHKVMFINISLLGYSGNATMFSENTPTDFDFSVYQSPRRGSTPTSVGVNTWVSFLNTLILSVEVGTFE